MRLNEDDQKRLDQLLRDFVDRCSYARPFHLVVIDSRAVAVVRYTIDGAEQVCSGPKNKQALKMLGPLTVVAVSSDGHCRSAQIEMVPTRVTMQ